MGRRGDQADPAIADLRLLRTNFDSPIQSKFDQSNLSTEMGTKKYDHNKLLITLKSFHSYVDLVELKNLTFNLIVCFLLTSVKLCYSKLQL